MQVGVPREQLQNQGGPTSNLQSPSSIDRNGLCVLSRADVLKAGQALSEAFLDYSLMKYAMEDLGRRRRGVEVIYGGILRDAFRHGVVMTTPDLAGVACWLPPGVGTMSLLRQWRAGMARVAMPFGFTGVRRLMAYDSLHRSLHHEYAPGPHWYLAALGVVPESQGQGVGSALLSPMMERADRERKACFLETQWERNVTLYARHGFEVVWTGKPEGHPIPTWAMLRLPH